MRNKGCFIGTCICGHSFDDHHHSICLNPGALKGEGHRIVNGVIAGECEAEQFEGFPSYENACNCQEYVDVGWVK